MVCVPVFAKARVQRRRTAAFSPRIATALSTPPGPGERGEGKGCVRSVHSPPTPGGGGEGGEGVYARAPLARARAHPFPAAASPEMEVFARIKSDRYTLCSGRREKRGKKGVEKFVTRFALAHFIAGDDDEFSFKLYFAGVGSVERLARREWPRIRPSRCRTPGCSSRRDP